MLRKVLTYTNYIHPSARGTGGSNALVLECGHTKRQKASVRIPERARCWECEMAQKNRPEWSGPGQAEDPK